MSRGKSLRNLLEGLPKEEIANADGRDDACEVGEQSSHDSVAGVANADTAEIDGKNVEGGVGAALEDARQTTYERVSTVGLHRIDHHAARART